MLVAEVISWEYTELYFEQLGPGVWYFIKAVETQRIPLK